MEIHIFKNIILDVILVIFPILLYLVLSIYKDNISYKYNNLLLNLSLILSLYLCLRFGIETANNKVLLFCNIPIIIAFIKKKQTLAIILSIINIVYCFHINETLFIINIIKYLSYFVLYYFARRRNLSEENFILSAAVLQAFFLSFEYFFLENQASINEIIILLILVFIYYFTSFFILYLFNIIDKIQKLNDTIKCLEKDKKVKDALFKLTHEIKNPLAVCQGYLEMIDLDKREKAEKYLNIMHEEISRSLNIMNDFVQMNKINIKKEKICLNTLIEDTYSSLKIIAMANKVKIICHSAKELLYFNGDYERLKQVLINIIKNSIESIDEKGTIEITTSQEKNNIQIIVKDNGCGMDSETLKHLKEMFYTTKANGTGLGVALSNEIIEAHQGKMIYSSIYNKGTSVTIRLPIK